MYALKNIPILKIKKPDKQSKPKGKNINEHKRNEELVLLNDY